MPNNIAAVICLTTGTSCLGHHDTRAELTWSAKASAASMPNSRCLCRAWRWTRSCSMRSASGEPRALKAPCGRASMQEGCFIFCAPLFVTAGMSQSQSGKFRPFTTAFPMFPRLDPGALAQNYAQNYTMPLHFTPGYTQPSQCHLSPAQANGVMIFCRSGRTPAAAASEALLGAIAQTAPHRAHYLWNFFWPVRAARLG